MKTLEDRLMALESSAWRWRAASGVLLVSLIAAVAWGAGQKPTVSDAVTTRELTVVNARGDTVLKVGSTEVNGDPFMRFMVDGKEAITAWASQGSVALRVLNTSGVDTYPCAELSTSKGKTAIRILKDKKTPFATLGHFRDDMGGGIIFTDKNGEIELRLPKDIIDP